MKKFKKIIDSVSPKMAAKRDVKKKMDLIKSHWDRKFLSVLFNDPHRE